MCEYFVCTYVCVLLVCLMPTEARRGCWVPGTGVIDSSEPPCGCWETNPGPLDH